VGNDTQFKAYCHAIGQPSLCDDPRFKTNPNRVIHREILIPLLSDIMKTHGRDHWLDALERVGVPAGPINTIEQVYQNPQVKAREMRQVLPHGSAGQAPVVASPLRFSDSPVSYRHAAPLLGEHTEQVLRERLGLSDAEIKELML
ncbi:MAG TPA: CoA transferase, partial [Candidimonas sp.]|nr:CoA transferase [Candidimonas sp.]